MEQKRALRAFIFAIPTRTTARAGRGAARPSTRARSDCAFGILFGGTSFGVGAGALAVAHAAGLRVDAVKVRPVRPMNCVMQLHPVARRNRSRSTRRRSIYEHKQRCPSGVDAASPLVHAFGLLVLGAVGSEPVWERTNARRIGEKVEPPSKNARGAQTPPIAGLTGAASFEATGTAFANPTLCL
jgi:hypothetical protein